MAQLVAAGGAFIAGLRAEALGTYRRSYQARRERLSKVMQLDIPSTLRTENYFYYQAAPYMVRWLRGETMQAKAFTGVRYSITNLRWARAIAWMNEDRADDQTGTLVDQARDLGRSAAGLDERVFFQILEAGTNTDLLPSIPNAPDGSALFLGSTRFGVSAGNIVTKSGTGIANVNTDFFTVLGTMRQFQDTEGQPLIDDTDIDGAVTVIAHSGAEEVFQKAFKQTMQVASSGNAGVSNVLKDLARNVTLWLTGRLTGATSTWYQVLEGTPVRPVFSQMREPLQEYFADMSNSDRAKDTGEESIRFYTRKGYGIHLPYSAAKVV
jgi:Mu-like prophage major head subunit gpT